jgi:adenine-specific DNA methylase
MTHAVTPFSLKDAPALIERLLPVQIEAARLGCDVYASDLNPVACMLTWGAFNIVGGAEGGHKQLAEDQKQLVDKVQVEIDRLGVEKDGYGWRAKVFLYCVEVLCPQPTDRLDGSTDSKLNY